jgi:EAL domain-containing protein (putative c-di-GMP-specific phosphodiesterase class I)
VQQADAAMYTAKKSGKNQVVFYTEEMGRKFQERLELEIQLRGAVERGEIYLEYQPEFHVSTNRVVRFEALARWRSAKGLIPPSKFIPVAEECGLIEQIGLWALRQACWEAKQWEEVSRRQIGIAVNVSALQVFREDFVENIAAVLDETGLPPRRLQLEMTESVMMPGLERSREIMTRLRTLGVSLVLDDFGTGYSSLSYLSRLPIDGLKIDRSFVSYLSQPKHPTVALMKSIVGLAHNLGIEVVAEGVETPQQLQCLQEMQCDLVQGFLLGRPACDVTQYLHETFTCTPILVRGAKRKVRHS